MQVAVTTARSNSKISMFLQLAQVFPHHTIRVLCISFYNHSLIPTFTQYPLISLIQRVHKHIQFTNRLNSSLLNKTVNFFIVFYFQLNATLNLNVFEKQNFQTLHTTSQWLWSPTMERGDSNAKHFKLQHAPLPGHRTMQLQFSLHLSLPSQKGLPMHAFPREFAWYQFIYILL